MTKKFHETLKHVDQKRGAVLIVHFLLKALLLYFSRLLDSALGKHKQTFRWDWCKKWFAEYRWGQSLYFYALKQIISKGMPGNMISTLHVSMKFPEQKSCMIEVRHVTVWTSFIACSWWHMDNLKSLWYNNVCVLLWPIWV